MMGAPVVGDHVGATDTGAEVPPVTVGLEDGALVGA